MLTRQLSVYLDLVRVIAAYAVLFSHLDSDGIAMGWMPLSRFSHEAVIVFFVLSGFIIHATTFGKGRGAGDYAIARASRIYSVAIPAILLSVGLGVFAIMHPGIEETALLNWRPLDPTDIWSSLFFLNESWTSPAALSMNGPYWSLCYEVWYYALFGCFVFAKGPWRWSLLAGAALLAGPAILLLFPIWLIGAALSRYGGAIRLSVPVAWTVFLSSTALIVLIDASAINATVREYLFHTVPGYWRLGSSQQFLTDYAIGLAIAAHFIAYTHLNAGFHALICKAERPIRYFAGFTFSLYLFHRPLTQIAGQMFPSDSVLSGIVAAVAITLICLALSYISERRLDQWRQVLRAPAQRLARPAT